MPTIAPHHQRLLAVAKNRFEADPAVEALLVAGSVAHGLAQAGSDLDILIVVGDGELERRSADHRTAFFDGDAADYEGGYLDGKYISRAFIAEVAERGSEPARWAFADAIVAFSRSPGLEELVRSAGAYPESEREQKLRDLLGHAMLMTWFQGEAEKRDDAYLMAYASSRLVLYAGRAILAHNRMLYPFHKWFLTMVERAPMRPADLPEQMRSLLADPTKARAESIVASVHEVVGIDLALPEAVSRFTERTEWNWRDGRAPLDDA